MTNIYLARYAELVERIRALPPDPDGTGLPGEKPSPDQVAAMLAEFNIWPPSIVGDVIRHRG